MLSDEEKREYEELKSLLYQGTISQYGKRKLIDIIEKQSKEIEDLKDFITKLQATKDRLDSYDKENTLEIEKLKKEIEELKQIKCKLDEKNIPIETLLAEFERLEDLEDDLTTVYLNGVYDGEKKVEDKIKAKIEDILNSENSEAIEKLIEWQSLLEKE